MKHTYLLTRYLLLTMMYLFITRYSLAQSTVSGTVTDADDGSAIPGVNVLVKGTSTGTVTDVNGQFNVTVSGENPTLVFSSIGYATQEVEVGGQSTVNVNMAPDIAELTEVIVTGYSVDSRRETTGSVATVAAEDLQVVPSGNVEQQLQGRVAGVTVITNGQPGTNSIVRVRGFGALGGNEPLYVVDGVPVETTEFLPPDDIETTTVLKDATTASIYGARAAGGVIVYTTKKGGRNQPMRVSYDGVIGVTTPGQGPEVMNPQDQATWTWNAIRNAAIQRGVEPEFEHPQYGTGQQPIIPDYLLVGNQTGVVGSVDLAAQAELYNTDFNAGPTYQVIRANKEGTDWYDEITRPAMLQRHNIGLSGGGENNRYYLGLGVQNQEGILRHSGFQRYHFRANSEFDVLPGKIRIGENIQATYRSTQLLLGANNQGEGGSGSSDDENIILQTSRIPSIIPVYDEFGGYGGTIVQGLSNAENPVATLDGDQNDNFFSVGLFGNVYLEAEPIENLVLRTSFGGRYNARNFEGYTRRTYEDSENNASFGYVRASDYVASWVWTNTANYKRTFGVHGIDLLLGQEVLNTGIANGLNGSGIDPFSQNPDFVTLSTVNSPVVFGGKFNGVTFRSYFGRINYDFNDKYLVSGVIRYDGSSRFGEENRNGFFPAFSAAWRISEEGFMSGVTFLDDMKIRGGYGIIGNSNNVDANNQFSLFGTSISQGNYDITGSNSGAVEGFYRTRIGNPLTTWEQSITTNVGFDALLFGGKLDVILDVWRKDTEDLLFRVPVTVQTGFRAEAPFVNVGKMRNEGIDLQIVGRRNVGDFGLEITANGSLLRNEIVNLRPDVTELPNRSSNYRGITPVLNRVGRPLSNFYGFDVVGLFRNQEEVDAAATQDGAAPGRFRFRDVNGDGDINLDDRVDLGDPIPDFTGGLTIKVDYRNFEVEAYTYASIGNDIYNISKLFTDFYPLFPGAAISERVKDTWTFADPTGDIPIFENVSNFSTNTQSNSFYVEDGSYLRLQNITLAYKLPVSILDSWGFEKFRIFAGVNNVFTISGYEGLDPAVGGAADTNFGVDLGNVPVTRSWTAGVNVIF